MVHRVTVRRGNIWEDTVSTLKFGWDERKHIHVTFLGESADDDGGPRREYFMLLMGSIFNNNNLLEGPVNRRILRLNTTALQV